MKQILNAHLEIIEFPEHPIANTQNEAHSLAVTNEGLEIAADFIINHRFSHYHYCQALFNKSLDLPICEFKSFLDYQGEQLDRKLNWLVYFETFLEMNERLFFDLNECAKHAIILGITRREIESLDENYFQRIEQLINEYWSAKYDFRSIKRQLDHYTYFRDRFSYIKELEEDYDEKRAYLKQMANKPLERFIDTEIEASTIEAKSQMAHGRITLRPARYTEKVRTHLSLPQLAMLFRLLLENGKIDIPNKTIFFHWISEHFQSKKSDAISWRSFRKHFDYPTDSAIKATHNLLLDLLNDLGRLEG